MSIPRTHPIVVLSVFLLAVGCASESSPRDEQPARGSLAKTDLVGSCQAADTDFCAGQSDGTCWCDEQCEMFGDCCADQASVCGDNECETVGGTCLGGNVQCAAAIPGTDIADLDCGGSGPILPQLTCCVPQPTCPQTCDDWCPMAFDCTLPDGCENPGCGCPETVCDNECETEGGTCLGGNVQCETAIPGTDFADLDCGGSGPILPQRTCCVPQP